jgi:hypothetical protein
MRGKSYRRGKIFFLAAEISPGFASKGNEVSGGFFQDSRLANRGFRGLLHFIVIYGIETGRR